MFAAGGVVAASRGQRVAPSPVAFNPAELPSGVPCLFYGCPDILSTVEDNPDGKMVILKCEDPYWLIKIVK